MSGNVKFNGWINDDGSENYKCRAWVNFNGTGTVAIRASGNVSSITDNGVGEYTVNFTTAMQDVNYCVTTSSRYYSASNSVSLIQNIANYTPVVGSVRLTSSSAVGTITAQIDVESFYVAIFR